jgi:hypothetical protein
MLPIAATLIFYSLLSAIAVLGYWFLVVRFGDTSDLDPQSPFMRWFGKRASAPPSSVEPSSSAVAERIAKSEPIMLPLPTRSSAKQSLIIERLVDTWLFVSETAGLEPSCQSIGDEEFSRGLGTRLQSGSTVQKALLKLLLSQGFQQGPSAEHPSGTVLDALNDPFAHRRGSKWVN